MLRNERKKRRLYPCSYVRLSYTQDAQYVLVKPLRDSGLRQFTGTQATEDWYLTKFGRVTITKASLVISFSDIVDTREDELAADHKVVTTDLGQQNRNAPANSINTVQCQIPSTASTSSSN